MSVALRSGPAGQDRPVTRKRRDISTYNEQRPNGIVEEDDRGNPEHGEAYNFVKLEERPGLAYLVGQTGDGRGAGERGGGGDAKAACGIPLLVTSGCVKRI